MALNEGILVHSLIAFIANFVPSLKYLPEWVPGTGWKRVIREWRKEKEYITAAPYKWTKEQIVSVKRARMYCALIGSSNCIPEKQQRSTFDCAEYFILLPVAYTRY